MQDIRGCSGAIVSGVVEGCMPSSITVGPADDLIAGSDRLLHNRRGVNGSNRISKLGRSGPSRNVAVDVWRGCFTAGKNQTQNQATANSTKGQHGRERATSRSRNSRSYGRRGGRVEGWKSGRVEGWKIGRGVVYQASGS
jgi:hypothetical protein